MSYGVSLMNQSRDEAFMNGNEMIQIVEQFSRKVKPVEGQVKVTQVPDYKTVHIEQIEGYSRSIMLSEYKVDGKIFRAGYSSRSDTIFISNASRG